MDTLTRQLADRLMRYCAQHTTADESSPVKPSTPGQHVLLERLAEELASIGMKSVISGGTLYSGRGEREPGLPVPGFIAHVDTSPDYSGDQVRPVVHEHYDGGDIQLPSGLVISPAMFPELHACKGTTIVTADGSTLLGADNKAGVAIIMTLCDLVRDPAVPFRIAFTTDEEIGRGMDDFDIALFDADYAYTIDGGAAGELEYETFNAAKAVITVRGRSVHPGSAKNRMINASAIAAELVMSLPAQAKPEHTADREGFYHLTDMAGDVAEARLELLIREHSAEKFAGMKLFLEKLCDFMSQKQGTDITVTITDQYRNMREKIEPVMRIVDIAAAAMRSAGVTPVIRPVRGGTDGARLSFMGVPCPNIFTGGANFHGPYEYVSVDTMAASLRTVQELLRSWRTEFSQLTSC